MRLNRATRTLVGTAAAAAVTVLAASPAWACKDSDPALRLQPSCGANGQPDWMVFNPNGWGQVPFTWSDDKGGHSADKLWAPANGSVALPTHATKVTVVAYRPDKRGMPVWDRHGTMGVQHCALAHPAPPAKKPTTPPPAHKPKPKHTATPMPTTAPPSGEARPAIPVKAQPNFTG